jgi:multiple sugar transport system substrate-binding protein
MPKGWFRFVAIALATLLLILGLQSLFSRPAPGRSPVTIKLSGWGSSPTEQHLFQRVLASFEAQHPEIKVKFEVIADQYMDVIKTRLIGDAAPDVFFLDALEAPFLMQGQVLEPLNAYITPDFELADFEENLLSAFQRQGQIYGLPKDYSTLALFYNKKAFAEAGLSRPPETWDELLAAAKPLTLDRNQDGRPDQYGLSVIPELARQAYLVRAFGGQVVDQQSFAAFAQNESLRGLNLTVSQYRTDRTSARPIDVGANSGIEMFGQGKAAMAIEGNWAIPFLIDTFPELEFGTAEVPKINDRSGTMVYSVGYVMSRQSRHKSEAWKLISYLTGKQGMRQWTGSGLALPTRKSVAQQLRYDADPLRSALVAGVKYATLWQAGQYPAAVTNNFNNQFISALLGEQPLQQALLQAQKTANKQIKESE